MTDASAQFAILCCLSATGTAAGAVLSAVTFFDKAVKLNSFIRFVSEFVTVAAAGLCLWLTVLYLNNGSMRMFFVFPVLFFSALSYICISKLLNPLIPKCKSVAKRIVNSRNGKFIARYILK